MVSCRLQQHSRFWFPALTVIGVLVRANVDLLDSAAGPANLVKQALVNLRHHFRAHYVAGDTALVRNNEHKKAILVQAGYRFCDAGKEFEILR